MLLRILTGIAFLMTMVGCATTKQTGMNQMELRIGELEHQVAQKDDEISDLQNEVSQLKDAKRKPKFSTEEVAAASSGKYSNIIRVNAAPTDVQAALKKAGYYTGNVDGKIGSNTKSAIMKFQKDNSLKADGVIGKQTWEKLQSYVE